MTSPERYAEPDDVPPPADPAAGWEVLETPWPQLDQGRPKADELVPSPTPPPKPAVKPRPEPAGAHRPPLPWPVALIRTALHELSPQRPEPAGLIPGGGLMAAGIFGLLLSLVLISLSMVSLWFLLVPGVILLDSVLLIVLGYRRDRRLD